MNKKDFAFDKTNFTMIAIGLAVVVIGFILMTGPSTTADNFEPDIFSARRIKVAPLVCLAGFLSMIYAVIRKPKGNGQEDGQQSITQDKNIKD